MSLAKSFVELVVGDLDEKRAYRQFMKQVDALPKDYRYAFKRIQKYLYNFGAAGSDMTTYEALLDLFEASAAEGKPVLDVIGDDVAAFCDELLHASATASTAAATTSHEKLNEEIRQYFSGKENNRA
ncbi:MAG: DUF1048 domain-containing protein [Raoultibacter sp.]